MVKQLYYITIHSKNIEIYLSKLYTGKYSEVNSINTFSDFLTSFNGYRKKGKIVKDEKKFHGAVDKSSLEQHFRKSDIITFVV